MNKDIAKNNFDLIRLIAAAQVAILHVLYYLSPEWRHALPVVLLDLIPGVPTFFFISGFLISRAFEKTSSLPDYARNRALRIFPALHVCVAINLLMVFFTGYFAAVQAGFVDVLGLYLAKTTFFQFYNPDFMRGFGDGVLNGSLWTICVELQFYILTPILYFLLVSKNRARTNLLLAALVVLSICCNRLLYSLQGEFGHTNVWKLARVSFLPWIYMFAVGMLAQRNFDSFARHLRGSYFPPAIALYLCFAWLMRSQGFGFDNSVSPLIFFPLVAVILLGAYSAPNLARTTLRGNDISYGLYIYHVPIMNMFLFYHLQGQLQYTFLVLALTLVLAAASWLLIEKPSLRRKRRATHPLPEAPDAQTQNISAPKADS